MAEVVAVAADHGGYELKSVLLPELRALGYEVLDLGTNSQDSVDYPDFAELVAQAVEVGRARFGMLICGSGIGMSIAANKVHGARAALVTDEWHAEMARRHNDANVICVGGRVNADEALGRFVDRFILTAFEGGRHATRVGKITALEK